MNQPEVEILLVEDNLHDAEMAMRALKKNKIVNNLVHLKNGAVASDFLFGKGEFASRDINIQPSLILLDLKMPKVDGIELLKIIKASELTKNIPVVILTSSRENPDIATCYALGANSYIVKPVEFDGFMKAVADLGFYWIMLNQKPV